jgi:hypothetical protein
MAFTEQRRYPRAKVAIPVEWGTASNCGYEGVITLLSLGGCLIKTRVHASRGQAVFIRMSLTGAGSDTIVLRGHVKYEMDGVGLGVFFAGLTKEEQKTIGDLVDFSAVQRASSS